MTNTQALAAKNLADMLAAKAGGDPMTAYEDAARRVKARKMADALLAQAGPLYWLSAGADQAPADFWLTVAKAAGCKAPSATTVAVVLDLLRSRATSARMVA